MVSSSDLLQDSYTRCSALGSRGPGTETSRWLVLTTKKGPCCYQPVHLEALPLHGDNECFRCMLSGHILYGYFVLLMVKWKRIQWKKCRVFYVVLQVSTQPKCFLNQSWYIVLKGVSMLHSTLSSSDCEFPFLYLFTRSPHHGAWMCVLVWYSSRCSLFLFEMLCEFRQKVLVVNCLQTLQLVKCYFSCY